jgi:AcrR family transcriptional regulator
MPRLWSETIDEHRREVREAIMETTADLVFARGLGGVTMTRIADDTGIGRATLYRYFPDVEAILRAWHEGKINGHLGQLKEVVAQAARPFERLTAVLKTFALISRESSHGNHSHDPPHGRHSHDAPHGHHDAELVAFLHRDERVARAQQELRAIIRDLLAEAARTGEVRGDVEPEELATYCLHALGGAGSLPSEDAARRLLMVTLAGLRAST